MIINCVIVDLLLFNVYGLFTIDHQDNTSFAFVIDCIGLLIIIIVIYFQLTIIVAIYFRILTVQCSCVDLKFMLKILIVMGIKRPLILIVNLLK